MPGEVLAEPIAQEVAVDEASRKPRAIGAVADDDLAAGEFEVEKRPDVFLDGNPAKVDPDRSG